MKKEMRLRLIRKLVSQHEITTQEDLRHLLYQQGLNVTQATLSRDIHELKLFKVRSKDGGFKYSIFNDQKPLIFEKLQHKNGENYPHVHTSEYDFRDENIEIACEVFKGLAGTN